MKKIIFLAKLYKENKLGLVEPSNEITDSYIKKSESNLVSARILLENNKLEEAVSLAYYSMYHMLTALLFRTGIKCENHSAGIILLKEVFDIDNKDISFAKKERVDKQYYTDFHITKQEVEEAIELAKKFNNHLLDFISRLDNQKTLECRNRLKDMV
jgi:uncharacterized protein (UPF0332 family)